MTADEASEHDWVTSGNPELMLGMLPGDANLRKLRLFACAACRLWTARAKDSRPEIDSALDVAERYADGMADGYSLKAAHREIWAIKASEWGGQGQAPLKQPENQESMAPLLFAKVICDTRISDAID